MKLKTILVSAFLMLLFMGAYAQPGFQWQKGFGGSGMDNITSTVADNAGNIYVVGFFENSVDFNTSSGNYTITAKGGKDGFVAKYLSNGNFVWARAFGGSGHDEARAVRIAANGDVVIGGVVNTTGGTIATADSVCQFFDATNTQYSVNEFGQSDVVFAKYNSAGNIIYAKIFGGSSTEMIGDLDIDANNNIYITGYFYDTTDLDPDTSVVVSYTSFSGTFGPGADIFLSKFNSNGQLIFGKRMGGLETDYGLAMDVTNNGFIYMTGMFAKACNFSAGVGFDTLQTASNSYTDQNAFVCKFDTSGNYQWGRQIGGSDSQTGYGIASDAAGNVFVGGYYRGSVSFNAGYANATSLTNLGITDGFVCKFTSTGGFCWGRRAGGASSDVINDIAIDAASNVYVTGYFYSFHLNFGSNAAGVVEVQPVSIASSNQDLFMAQYDSAGTIQWARGFGDATGGDLGNAITIQPNTSTIILAGYSNGMAMDFDPSSQVSNFTANGGSYDAFFAKYSDCSINRTIGKDSLKLQVDAGFQAYQWIDCNTNIPIAGATQNIYNPTLNGTYACVITGSANCIDTTDCINITSIIECTLNVSISKHIDTLMVSEPNATYQWIVCPSGGIVVSATHQYYVPVFNAAYACKVTTSNGCEYTTNCISMTDVGFNDYDFDSEITLSPNPTKNVLTVKLPNAKDYVISISDIGGQEVESVNYSINNNIINTDKLANGVYFLKIRNKNTAKQTFRKFVKQ